MSIRYSLHFYRTLVLIMLALTGCRSTGSQSGVLVDEADHVAVQQELLLPADTLHAVYDGLLGKKPVTTFYQHTDGKPVWLDDNGLNPQGDSLISIIQHAGYYGVAPGRYHQKELVHVKGSPSKNDLLRTETLLTDAFLALAHDLKFGLQSGLDDSTQADLLKMVIREGGLKRTLEAREPEFPGYHSLKQVLKTILDKLAAGNVGDSVRKRHEARLIAINLERWRHESRPLGQRHIMINIPSFMLYVIENADTILSSKVIVGNVKSPTPQLSSVITNLTIYPYWHVPRKIAVEEYLPAIQKDTSFIRRNNFEVLDRQGRVIIPDTILWRNFHRNYFPVSLRQREGVENSLGVIKFYFRNPFAVYLHDTNAKKLFRSKARAFSHGCIRMEESEALAHYLVTGGTVKRSGTIEKNLVEKRRSVVQLQHPIPIHIRYFTVDVVSGKPIFYNDIYGADVPLPEGLFAAEPASML